MNKSFYLLLAALVAVSAVVGGCTAANTSLSAASSAASGGLSFPGSANGISSEVSSDSDKADDSSDSETKEDNLDIANTTRVQPGTVDLSRYSGAIELKDAGEYTLTGTLKDGMVYVHPAGQVVLHLAGATIENPIGPAIYAKKADLLTLDVAADTVNTLANGESEEYAALNAAVYSKVDLCITGSGTLNVTGNYGHAIKAKDNALVSGEVALTLTAQKDGLHVNEVLTIESGSIIVPQATEGIESKDSIIIQGGTLDIFATDDGINAANSIEIFDGTLHVVSTGNDAIDSNGTLTVHGGQITAFGLSSPECAFDCDNRQFTIDGGTLLGFGSSMSAPNNGGQYVLLVGAEEAVESLRIEDVAGTVVYETTVEDYSGYVTAREFGERGAAFGGNGTFGGGSNETSTGESAGDFPFGPRGQQPQWDGAAPGQEKEEPAQEQGQFPAGQPEAPNDLPSDSFEFSQRGERLPGEKVAGGFGNFGSTGGTMLISCEGLQQGVSYSLFVNRELLETVTLSQQVTTVGNASVGMGGFGGKNGMRGNRQFEFGAEQPAEQETPVQQG